MICLHMQLAAEETPVEAPKELRDLVTLPPRPQPFHKVYFMGAEDPLICLTAVVDKKKGTITYASIENKIKVTKSLNRLDSLEPAIGPAELMSKRGEQLLSAYVYPQFHEEMQLEFIRFLKWATEDDVVQDGSEEVDAPWEEAAEVAIAAIGLFPSNEKLADITLNLLINLDDDERLEPMLVATLKVSKQWDHGFIAMAELLERQTRDQELYSFVKAWAKTHSSSTEANQWLVEQALLNGDMKLAKDAARRLWLRKRQPKFGAILAKIYLMSGKGVEALKIANEVLAIEGIEQDIAEEMKIIAGSALLAQGKLDEAGVLLEAARDSDSEQLQKIAAHNLGVLYWMRGERREARSQWKNLEHPASQLAFAIANRRRIASSEVTKHPALAQTANELNACLALERQDGERALQLLKSGRSERQLFLRRIGELLQGKFNIENIKSLNFFSGSESKLWRAYAHIQVGEFIKAEAVLKDLPQDNGYAAVYRVYCAEGLGDSKRAEKLFLVAQKSKGAPPHYLREMESHYLTLKSSREKEDFKWPAGELLRTGWFSQTDKTGIHIFAQGEYLAFEGTQAAKGVSRAWRKRSKERLRKIKATFDMSKGWSGLELIDEKGGNGLAIAIESIDAERVIVWRRLAEGAWSMWNTLEPCKGNSVSLMIDDSLIGNDQIQLISERGDLTPLGSLADIPGSHMRVGFFAEATTGGEVNLKVKELVFEVRPEEK
ncbi:MAG: hypothetical protein HRU15_01280 [Planctomycetes bacterium]|nr:hypothetical protein [Planctomycetota bacterium]